MTNTGDLIIPSGANCTFKAGSRIYISGTFKAEKGAVFKAQPR
jgi:hypothetical protein